MTNTVHRQCTLCEAHCGITVEVDGRAGDPDHRRSRRRDVARLHLPEGRRRWPTCTQIRTGLRRRSSAWATDSSRSAGTRRSRSPPTGCAGSRIATAPTPWPRTSATPAPTPPRCSPPGSPQAARHPNNYSATSADQLPQHRVALEMFGHFALLPVPDIERTEHLLDARRQPGGVERVDHDRARHARTAAGDPRPGRPGRRRRPAPHRDGQARLRARPGAPGGDAYLLLGMLHTLFAEDASTSSGSLAPRSTGWTSSSATGRRLDARAGGAARRGRGGDDRPAGARVRRRSERPSPTGGWGSASSVTGTVTHWLINALNVVTGNFDRPGGAMFTTPAVDVVTLLERVDGAPTEPLPPARERAARVRRRAAGGRPGRRDPHAGAGPGPRHARLRRQPGAVDPRWPPARRGDGSSSSACVAVDMYVTETTRHAHVILPPVSHLERDDVDVVFPPFAVRNHIRYNPAALPSAGGGRTDWQILDRARRADRPRPARAAPQPRPPGCSAPLARRPSALVDVAPAHGPVRPRSPRPVAASTSARSSASTTASISARSRPGSRAPCDPGQARPPGAGGVASTEAAQLDDDRRPSATRPSAAGFDLTLIGRRQLRSNNSWMHNSPRLMKGSDRCTALLHPDDAEARGLPDGRRSVSRRPSARSNCRSRSPTRCARGRLDAARLRPPPPGVGWRLRRKQRRRERQRHHRSLVVDRLTGNAAFNAVPVRVEAVVAADVETEATADIDVRIAASA